MLSQLLSDLFILGSWVFIGLRSLSSTTRIVCRSWLLRLPTFPLRVFPTLHRVSQLSLSSNSLPVLSGASSRVLGMSARGVIVRVCSGSRGAFSACALFHCGYMQRALAFLAMGWFLMVTPSCRYFGGSPPSLIFRWVSFMLLLFVLVMFIPPPWFSDSIGSKVSLAASLPFGLSQCRLALALLHCLGFWGMLVSLLLGFGAVVSHSGWRLWCLLPFSLLYGRASLLMESYASFSIPVSLRNVVALWVSQGFAWASVSFRSQGSLHEAVSLWFVSGFHLVL